MRYIGNKTKLLSFLADFLRSKGITPGVALDAFAGTASVAKLLKKNGFRTISCDILTSSYVLQRAYTVVDSFPGFRQLHDEDFHRVRSKPSFAAIVESRFGGQGELFGKTEELGPLEEVLVYLDTHLRPQDSFITANFSAADSPRPNDRMYFTRENGQRIDAIRHRIEEWRVGELVTEDEYFILLSALLEAADRVANTTGVYAAYVKTWQSNALKKLRLEVPDLITGTGFDCEAHRMDVLELVGRLPDLDLAYLDPPYNTRQYAGYYHIPELLAEGWFDGEPDLRGKTGLIPDQEKKSDWSTRDGCVPALEALISSVNAKHIVMSYNNEGIIPEEQIERIFREYGRQGTYERVAKKYSRYKADAEGPARQYKDDSTTEYLYYVALSS